MIDSRTYVTNPYNRRVATLVSSSSNTVFSNIADFSVTLPVGNYLIKGTVHHQSAAATTGLVMDFAGGTLTATAVAGYLQTNVTAATFLRINTAALATVLTLTGTGVLNTAQLADFVLIFNVSVTGTFIPRFRSEVNASAVQVNVNSYMQVYPL